VPSLLVKSGLSHMSFLSLLTLFPIQWPKVLRSPVGARGGGLRLLYINIDLHVSVYIYI
jgi:hypothetical protein